MDKRSAPRAAPPAGLSVAVFLALAILPTIARASFLPPELMDKAAMGIAWFIIVVVPIAGIVLFWSILTGGVNGISSDMRAVTQQNLALYPSQMSLLRVRSEQRVQRVNAHLALGGGFGS